MTKILISSQHGLNQNPSKNSSRFQVVNHWWPYTQPGIVFFSHVRPEYAIYHCGSQIWDRNPAEIGGLNELYANEFNGDPVFTQIAALWKHWLGKDSGTGESILEEEEDL